ncbi:MAG: glycogen synthase, partial [Gemmatimonadetes bacterium]|nr:glycogen synthase [Gemmatimonadota bacterium]
SPFAKTGGLADVAGALPRELRRRGHDVRLFLPLHGVIDRQVHGFAPVDGTEMTLELDGRQLPFSLQSPTVDEGTPWIYAIDCPELFRRDAVYTSDPDE